MSELFNNLIDLKEPETADEYKQYKEEVFNIMCTEFHDSEEFKFTKFTLCNVVDTEMYGGHFIFKEYNHFDSNDAEGMMNLILRTDNWATAESIRRVDGDMIVTISVKKNKDGNSTKILSTICFYWNEVERTTKYCMSRPYRYTNYWLRKSSKKDRLLMVMVVATTVLFIVVLVLGHK